MAIAFISAGDAGHTNSSGSHSTTVNIPVGTDLFVILAISTILDHAGNAAPNAATVNGVAATMIAQTPTADQNTEWITMFFFLSPPTGNQTVAVTGATGGTVLDTGFMWSAYSGAKQSGQPDSSGKTNQQSIANLAVDTTVVAPNSWVVAAYGSQQVAASITNATSRISGTPNDVAAIADSNGPVATGLYEVTFTHASQFWNAISASFAPATTVASTSNFFEFM